MEGHCDCRGSVMQREGEGEGEGCRRRIPWQSICSGSALTPGAAPQSSSCMHAHTAQVGLPVRKVVSYLMGSQRPLTGRACAIFSQKAIPELLSKGAGD